MGGEHGGRGTAERSRALSGYLARFHLAPGERPVFGVPEPGGGSERWRPRYSQAPHVWDEPQAGWVAARAAKIGTRLLWLGLIGGFVMLVRSVFWLGEGWTGGWGFRADAIVLWLGVSLGALFSASSRGRRVGAGLCALLIPVAYLAAEATLGEEAVPSLFAATGTLGAAAWLLARRRNLWSVLAALVAAPLTICLWSAMRDPGVLDSMIGATPRPEDLALLAGLTMWAAVLSAIVAVWAGVLLDKVRSLDPAVPVSAGARPSGARPVRI